MQKVTSQFHFDDMDEEFLTDTISQMMTKKGSECVTGKKSRDWPYMWTQRFNK